MKRNWEYLSIGVCFPSIKNGANIKQIAGANGYPITRIETLSGGAFNRDRMGYANIVDLTKYQDYILESGDLLLSHINSKAYIGRTVKYEKQGDEKIIHGMNLLRLRANPEVISSSLFAYYSKSMKFKDAVARIRKDAVNQSSMAISDLKKIIVPIPPLSEQSRIVAELDLLTGIIDKQNTQLKELDNLAQAIFYDMFGDPIENPKGWNVKNLGSVCDFKNGLNFAPDETGEKYYLIGVSDFQTKSRLECNQSLKTIELNKPLSEEYLLVDDDILFVRSNGNKDLIARNVLVAIKGLKVTYSGFCIRARVKNNDVLPFFLNSLLKLPSAHNALTASGHGCNIANLNQKTLDGFQLILPPLALQQSFAEKIQSIEKQKEAIRASIVDTQKLLDYTMDKYFG